MTFEQTLTVLTVFNYVMLGIGTVWLFIQLWQLATLPKDGTNGSYVGKSNKA